jgi:uncharacterized membrane protein
MTEPNARHRRWPRGCDPVRDQRAARSVVLLALGGAGNVLELLLTYAALRVGKVGIVASIVSTEGAIAAVLALIAGEALSPGAGVTSG